MVKPTAEDRQKYPELFVEDALIDPRTTTRTVPCKILSMGLPRTGSVSLGKALEILGYGPIVHGFNSCFKSKSNQMWEEGVEAKWPGSTKSKVIRDKVRSGAIKPFGRLEFDQLLGEYEVMSDMPCVAFAPELIAAYPEAKVIIVERDVDSWFRSFQIAWSCYDKRIALALVGRFDAQLRSLISLNRSISRGYFGADGKKQLRAREKAVYTQHYADIRKVTPPERLLDFKLQDGWEPLCAFLGCDVPDVPFPRLNDANEYLRKTEIMGWTCYQRMKQTIFRRKTSGVAL